MNRVIEAFSELKTEEYLSENWVQRVWTLNGFSSYVPFPSEFEVYLEEVNICTLLNNFNEALRHWFHISGGSLKEVLENEASVADTSNISEQNLSWQVLISEGIECKSIVCIIGTLILRFLDEPTSSELFKEALVAIRLYSHIVAIPGSHICQVFNSTLYSHVVSVIKICCEQVDSTLETKSKGVKRKKNDDNDQDHDDTESNQLSSNKTEVISLTSEFLSNLKLIFKNKKFKMDETSLNLTIQILLIITRLEKIYTTILANDHKNNRAESVSHLAYKSFMILLDLSGLLHNNPATSVKLLVKSMLPIFLIAESNALGLGQKEGSIVRSNYTIFLKILLDKLGESAYEAINILVQRICVAVPDRADMRLKASMIVLDILKVSPPDLQAEEIYSIVFMSHMAETKIRLLTLEIISKLLLEVDAISMTQLPQKYAAVTNDEFLLAVILYRCQDVVTSISTKALSYLDQLISSANTNRRAKKLVDKIFVEPYIAAENPEEVPVYRKEIFDTQRFLSDEEQFLDDGALNPLPGVKMILDMLVYFSQEDKVFIKKSARQTLGKIFLYNRIWIKMNLLQVFLIGCDDSSILVRKTMSQILTELLSMYPDHNDLITCWVEGVVPMIADEEAKAQEKVIEHYCKIILNNIEYFDRTTNVVSRLPWLVMKEILAQGKQSYLHYAVGKWVQTSAIKNKTIQIIYSHLNGGNNDVAWCLLVSLAQFMKLPDADRIYKYYQDINPDLNTLPHTQIVLETLYYVCPILSKEDKEKLFQQLEAGLVNCTVPFKLIARSRDICEQILSTQGGKKTNNHNAVVEWSTPKIQACMQAIECQIGKNAPPEIQNTEILIKHILMVGEFAQAAPKSINQSHIKLLQNLLLSPRKREADAWKGRVSNAVKAVTILTLVKLVLQKEDAAKMIMPIFREILSSSSVDATIQINTIIGMCDLCSRYTTLVERYFTNICKCFNSQYESVRKTALVCVVKRIREEYVKLRSYIFFPMITMILDKSDDIKRYIATFINVDLKKRNNVLETFYTGLFFFLNNSKEHSTTVKIPEELRVIFSFTDEPENRNYIYIYILDKLADTPRRLHVCKKIVNDILASVAEEKLKIDEKMENILTDAFNVLIDNEKKISEAISKNKKGNNEDVDDIEEMGEGNRDQQKKSNQSHGIVNVTEALRLSEANEIVPVIVKLRLRLKKCKSKSLKSLMIYMCELMRNFRNEMTDLLGSESELKAEVEYTLRCMEQEEDRRRQEAIAATEANSNEIRAEDERNNIPVITTSPEEICEQLQSLIVQLSRCDNNNLRSKEIAPSESNGEQLTKPSKNDGGQVETETNKPVTSVPSSPRSRIKSTNASPVLSKAPTPRRGSVSRTESSEPPSPIPRRKSAKSPPSSGSVPQSPRILSPPPPPVSPRSRIKSSAFVSSTPLPVSVTRSHMLSPPPPSPKFFPESSTEPQPVKNTPPLPQVRSPPSSSHSPRTKSTTTSPAKSKLPTCGPSPRTISSLPTSVSNQRGVDAEKEDDEASQNRETDKEANSSRSSMLPKMEEMDTEIIDTSSESVSPTQTQSQTTPSKSSRRKRDSKNRSDKNSQDRETNEEKSSRNPSKSRTKTRLPKLEEMEMETESVDTQCKSTSRSPRTQSQTTQSKSNRRKRSAKKKEEKKTRASSEEDIEIAPKNKIREPSPGWDDDDDDVDMEMSVNVGIQMEEGPMVVGVDRFSSDED